jgi:hypothetical protein
MVGNFSEKKGRINGNILSSNHFCIRAKLIAWFGAEMKVIPFSEFKIVLEEENMRKNNKLFKSVKILTKNPFPNDKGIIEQLSDPNYEGNLGLPLNPTPLQVAKYEICQNILSYSLRNKIPLEDLSEKISLSSPETKELLFCHIHKFTLDRLTDYASKLFSPFHIGVIEAEPRLKEYVQN